MRTPNARQQILCPKTSLRRLLPLWALIGCAVVVAGFAHAGEPSSTMPMSAAGPGATLSGVHAQVTAAGCESLSALVLPHARITQAQAVTGGSFTPRGLPAKFEDLPPFCRVAISSSPTADSLILIEVWIPLGKAWNGRYLQSGCGGFCGQPNYQSLAFSIRRGYAGAATDDGSQIVEPKAASSYVPLSNGSFALRHPEKVIDFDYRALKETTEDAKRIIAAFRPNGPRYSYFMGCSDGGREALMEAQRFPDDFNGIIVGAPANDWTHQLAGQLANEQALLDQPASYVPLAKLPILSKAVLARCRSHDTGAPGDDFLSDPEACDFHPAAIQCAPSQNPDTCLTPAQVAAVAAVYGGPRDARSSKPITAGFPPTGSEDASWPIWLIGASREADLNTSRVTPTLASFMNHSAGALEFFYANHYFENFVYKDPQTFDFRTVDIREAIAKSEEGAGRMIDATNPNLRPFEMHGGKIIQYHGWADPVLTPWTSVNYYNRVNAFMYGESPSRTPGKYEQIKSFYRLFMVPGMAHCAYGPGANAFGRHGNSPVTDAKHDILTALNRWVEHGVAPKKIIATHYFDNDPAKRIQFQRPLCPYPQFAQYNGHGNPADASSFTCADEGADARGGARRAAHGS
jgi:hypothetical protein